MDIGKGGFAICLEVEDMDSGRRYALKVIGKNLILKYKLKAMMLS